MDSVVSATCTFALGGSLEQHNSNQLNLLGEEAEEEEDEKENIFAREALQVSQITVSSSLGLFSLTWHPEGNKLNMMIKNHGNSTR